MTHAELIQLAEKWLVRDGCTVVVTDMTSAAGETPDAIGWKSGESILVECKTSRADFHADSHKAHRQPPIPHWGGRGARAMGVLRFFLAPKGMLRSINLLPGWGLLEAVDQRAYQVVPSARHDTTRVNEIDLLTSCVRRLVCEPTVRGIRCRVYRFEGTGEPRATIGAQP